MNNILKTSTVLLTLSLALSTGAAYAAPTTTSAKNDAAQTTVSANQKHLRLKSTVPL